MNVGGFQAKMPAHLNAQGKINLEMICPECFLNKVMGLHCTKYLYKNQCDIPVGSRSQAKVFC